MKSFSSRLGRRQPGDRKSVTELTAVFSVCLSSGCCRFLSSGRIKPSLISVQKNTSIWETPRNKTPFECCGFEAPFRGVFHASARLGLPTTKRPRLCPLPRRALASEHATGRRRRRIEESGGCSLSRWRHRTNLSSGRPAGVSVATATAADANANPLCWPVASRSRSSGVFSDFSCIAPRLLSRCPARQKSASFACVQSLESARASRKRLMGAKVPRRSCKGVSMFSCCCLCSANC